MGSLESVADTARYAEELDGVLFWAISGRSLGDETVNRLLALNQENDWLAEATVADLERIAWGKTPVAQGLREVGDFAVGQTVLVRDEVIANLSQGEVIDIEHDELRVSINGWMKNISPQYAALFTPEDVAFYRKSPTHETGRGRMSTPFANCEITLRLAYLGVGPPPDEALTRKVKRNFNVKPDRSTAKKPPHATLA